MYLSQIDSFLLSTKTETYLHALTKPIVKDKARALTTSKLYTDINFHQMPITLAWESQAMTTIAPSFYSKATS